MKKILKLAGLLTILALISVSCGKDPKMDTDTGKEQYGSVVVSSLNKTGNFELVVSRAGEDVDVNEFTVRIFGTTSQQVQYDSTWTKYSDMPAVLSIPSGNYTIEAYNGAQVNGFESPYYYGSRAFTVEPQEVVDLSLVCELACIRLSVEFTDVFLQYIDEGVCTITSKEGYILEFTPEEERYGYMAVPADSTLYVNVTGVFKENNKELPQQTYVISRIQAKDWHKISLSVSSAGEINGDDLLQVDHSVNERETNVLIPGGEDVIGNNGDEGNWGDDGNGEEPGNGDKDPTVTGVGFDIDQILEITDEQVENEVTVDVELVAPNGGIKNLFLWMESEDEGLDFIFSMGLGLGDKDNPGDLANPTGSEPWFETIESIGLVDLENPVAGKEKHIFSVGPFMTLLSEGFTHKFHITIVDAQGESVYKVLTVARTE